MVPYADVSAIVEAFLRGKEAQFKYFSGENKSTSIITKPAALCDGISSKLHNVVEKGNNLYIWDLYTQISLFKMVTNELNI